MNVDILRDKKYYSGIVGLEFTDEGVFPMRLSPEYLSFCDRDELYQARGRSCASIKLRFITDANEIKFRCSYLPADDDANYISDLYVDGKYHSSFGPGPGVLDFDGTIFKSSGSKLRRFQIYFQLHFQMLLRSITFEGATVVEQQPAKRPLWLALGDSITEGAHVKHPADTYVETAARLLDLDTINLGVGGEIMEPQHAEAASTYEFDLATIAYGVNDWARSIPVYRYLEKARQAADTLLKLGKPVIFITPASIINEQHSRNSNGHSLEDFREAILILTRERTALRYIDGKDLLPPDPEFFNDDIHPNRAGYIHYGQALAEKMQGLNILNT